MIQLYARVDELSPREGMILDHKILADLMDSLLMEGMKFAIKINPEGEVDFGNSRYFAARDLGWEYVPIDPYYLFGLNQGQGGQIISLRFGLQGYLPFSLGEPRPVYPQKTSHPAGHFAGEFAVEGVTNVTIYARTNEVFYVPGNPVILEALK